MQKVCQEGGACAIKITSSYSVEILRASSVFKETVAIYRSAVTYCVSHINNDWTDISAITKAKARFNYTEHLFHSTKANSAKYDFDRLFYKMPSYLRRAAISAALGAVASYRSNHSNWLKNGCKGKEPQLGAERLCMPCFYNKEMYLTGDAPYSVNLKLFIRGDWVWLPVHIKKTDADYLSKRFGGVKPSAPVLERRYGKYFLRFAYQEDAELSDSPIEKQRICAVDLGINTDAVCSIMDYRGTILDRKFINFPCDKDHMGHVLNRIRKFQRENNAKDVASFWNYAKRINKEHASKIAHAIVQYAVANKADVVVFEHLDTKGKKHGSKKQRLAMWRKSDVQNITTLNAHRSGMRVSRICAWGTSMLAFDGSGVVARGSAAGQKSHSICKFQNGKTYNCDLNASYNIGARYFIRQIIKPLPVTTRSQVEAKVPSLERRTSCTLATLRELNSLVA